MGKKQQPLDHINYRKKIGLEYNRRHDQPRINDFVAEPAASAALILLLAQFAGAFAESSTTFPCSMQSTNYSKMDVLPNAMQSVNQTTSMQSVSQHHFMRPDVTTISRQTFFSPAILQKPKDEIKKPKSIKASSAKQKQPAKVQTNKMKIAAKKYLKEKTPNGQLTILQELQNGFDFTNNPATAALLIKACIKHNDVALLNTACGKGLSANTPLDIVTNGRTLKNASPLAIAIDKKLESMAQALVINGAHLWCKQRGLQVESEHPYYQAEAAKLTELVQTIHIKQKKVAEDNIMLAVPLKEYSICDGPITPISEESYILVSARRLDFPVFQLAIISYLHRALKDSLYVSNDLATFLNYILNEISLVGMPTAFMRMIVEYSGFQKSLFEYLIDSVQLLSAAAKNNADWLITYVLQKDIPALPPFLLLKNVIKHSYKDSLIAVINNIPIPNNATERESLTNLALQIAIQTKSPAAAEIAHVIATQWPEADNHLLTFIFELRRLFSFMAIIYLIQQFAAGFKKKKGLDLVDTLASLSKEPTNWFWNGLFPPLLLPIILGISFPEKILLFLGISVTAPSLYYITQSLTVWYSRERKIYKIYKAREEVVAHLNSTLKQLIGISQNQLFKITTNMSYKKTWCPFDYILTDSQYKLIMIDSIDQQLVCHYKSQEILLLRKTLEREIIRIDQQHAWNYSNKEFIPQFLNAICRFFDRELEKSNSRRYTPTQFVQISKSENAGHVVTPPRIMPPENAQPIKKSTVESAPMKTAKQLKFEQVQKVLNEKKAEKEQEAKRLAKHKEEDERERFRKLRERDQALKIAHAKKSEPQPKTAFINTEALPSLTLKPQSEQEKRRLEKLHKARICEKYAFNCANFLGKLRAIKEDTATSIIAKEIRSLALLYYIHRTNLALLIRENLLHPRSADLPILQSMRTMTMHALSRAYQAAEKTAADIQLFYQRKFSTMEDKEGYDALAELWGFKCTGLDTGLAVLEETTLSKVLNHYYEEKVCNDIAFSSKDSPLSQQLKEDDDVFIQWIITVMIPAINLFWLNDISTLQQDRPKLLFMPSATCAYTKVNMQSADDIPAAKVLLAMIGEFAHAQRRARINKTLPSSKSALISFLEHCHYIYCMEAHEILELNEGKMSNPYDDNYIMEVVAMAQTISRKKLENQAINFILPQNQAQTMDQAATRYSPL